MRRIRACADAAVPPNPPPKPVVDVLVEEVEVVLVVEVVVVVVVDGVDVVVVEFVFVVVVVEVVFVVVVEKVVVVVGNSTGVSDVPGVIVVIGVGSSVVVKQLLRELKHFY